MLPMRYEKIIRRVFNCDRLGDPARIANTDTYSDSDLDMVKAGLAYANAHAICRAYKAGRDSLAGNLEKLFETIWGAETTADLDSVVEKIYSSQAEMLISED
ncbi:MAG: hypothetical protein EA369_02180 [Bradymonadales bacterium]|nr:MAG: hypothetical protein EA369_02180 [Bradymonadales bacterium]